MGLFFTAETLRRGAEVFGAVSLDLGNSLVG